ncbi:MAG: ATP-dependent sacrificial sulfur transferase LarE [Candidatus Rifleibacteriota bacterium]
MTKLNQAIENLKDFFTAQERVAIAFSGGMDSSFLALFAQKHIPGKYIALLVNSQFMSESELNIARSSAEKYKLNLKEIKVDVLSNPDVLCNSLQRCYHCKKAIFTILLEQAQGATLCEGSVTDDDDDFRPGKLALSELRIKSPLKDSGFSKDMIAEALRNFGAGELIRPAQSCLATRLATGVEISGQRLRQIELGERILREAGLTFFRLRHHGEIARIEVNPSEIHKAFDLVRNLSDELKKLGFRHIALDVDGYKKGSMNRQ